MNYEYLIFLTFFARRRPIFLFDHSKQQFQADQTKQFQLYYPNYLNPAISKFPEQPNKDWYYSCLIIQTTKKPQFPNFPNFAQQPKKEMEKFGNGFEWDKFGKNSEKLST